MLIYARNQTFCSKSVNKAVHAHALIMHFNRNYEAGKDAFTLNPKKTGLNILCGILSNYTWKNFGIKINFLCILLFYEFMYFFVFFTFLFLFFSVKFVADTFWSTIMLKQINFSHWE